MALNISQRGIDLIKQYEGFQATAYKCPAGKWTIGYGTIAYPDGKDVKQGDGPCTEAQALQWLTHEVNKAALPAIRSTDINLITVFCIINMCTSIGGALLAT